MGKLEFIEEFTNAYKANANDIYLREALCTYIMHRDNRSVISEKDYYVSCFPSPICGFGSRGSGFLYYCDIEALKLMLYDCAEADKKRISNLISFWKKNHDKDKIREEYCDDIKKTLPEDDFVGQYVVSYPLYRLGGAYLDFEKLVNLGLCGLIEEIKKKLEKVDNSFLRASLHALEYGKEIIDLYAKDCEHVNPELSQVLHIISTNKPRNSREALQLIWMYVGFSEVRNYGRLDVVLKNLATTYDHDYKSLFEFFKTVEKRNTIFNGRIIIGGKDRDDVQKADYFAKLMLTIMKDTAFTEPQLSLRMYKGMSDELFNIAMESIAKGRSYPLLYNDDVNIPNVMRGFGVNEEVANEYVPFGCGEYVINHKSIGSPNGIINLTKLLEGVLNNKRCLLTGREITKYCIDTPNSFEELWEVLKLEIEHQIDILAKQETFEYRYMNKTCGYLYTSILYDTCVDRGKSFLNGGIDNLGGTLETYGNVNFSDSLFSIKELVFNKRLISFDKLKSAVNRNFEGESEVLNLCKNVKKYGNDFEEPDRFLNMINEFIAKTAKEKASVYGLSTYMIVIINNHANTQLGFRTHASYDGRKSQEPLANALTPQAGAEKEGITAVLNSVSSLDLSKMAGAVYNLKLSKDLVFKHLDSVKVIIKTFFEKGGTQVMINVVDQRELEDAVIHPEMYQNLIVRVGGFSARFIDLQPLVQQEIITRMMY